MTPEREFVTGEYALDSACCVQGQKGKAGAGLIGYDKR
jgi:hypothetical protein